MNEYLGVIEVNLRTVAWATRTKPRHSFGQESHPSASRRISRSCRGRVRTDRRRRFLLDASADTATQKRAGGHVLTSAAARLAACRPPKLAHVTQLQACIQARSRSLTSAVSQVSGPHRARHDHRRRLLPASQQQLLVRQLRRLLRRRMGRRDLARPAPAPPIGRLAGSVTACRPRSASGTTSSDPPIRTHPETEATRPPFSFVRPASARLLISSIFRRAIELARNLGLNRSYVQRLLKKHGLTKRRAVERPLLRRLARAHSASSSECRLLRTAAPLSVACEANSVLPPGGGRAPLKSASSFSLRV